MTTRNLTEHGDIIDPELPVEIICDVCDLNTSEYNVNGLEMTTNGGYPINDLCDGCIKETLENDPNVSSLMRQKCGDENRIFQYYEKHLCLECIKGYVEG